jgi:putative acetyltransferase
MKEGDLQIRLTVFEDAPYLMEWLSKPDALCWFPMFDAREIEDAVRIWVSYAKIQAGLTATLNGVPCGMATLYIQPFKKLAHTCLFSIIVREDMRGKGVGKALLTELIKKAKEQFQIEVLHLEVYEGNPAKKLYETLGFRPFGYQAHFIKDKGEYIGKFFMQREL